MIAIREAKDSDGYDLSALLGAVFAEYEGCVFAQEEMPELLAIATTFRNHGGRFFVAHREVLGRPILVGCVGFAPHDGGLELKKLYVAARERKSGLGGRLTHLVETEAVEREAAFLELWSDTRFTTAHTFYERRGYVRSAETRHLHDASGTVEFHFRKVLT